MKEWDSTDIRGLAIINHQRGMPPLKRSNDNVFTDQQVEDAMHQQIALVTTWDLFRLVRAKIEFGWEFEAIREMFYTDGRISLIPNHWQRIGQVVHYYAKNGVVSILLEGDLSAGSKLGFLLPHCFIEEKVTSLQVEGNSVDSATSGQRVGHKTSYSRSELPVGLSVYLIN